MIASRALSVVVAAALLGACLEPSAPYLDALDTQPPSVLATTPPAPDGGVGRLAVGSQIAIRFTELMDLRTLRPGIVLLKGQRLPREEVPLLISTPNPAALRQANDADVPFDVRAEPTGQLLPAGNTVYTLVLRTVLADEQGNTLPEEFQVNFTVSQ